MWRWDGANWTWIAGTSATDQAGVYPPSYGVRESSAHPGGRLTTIGWTDAEGSLYLYGGRGYGNSEAGGEGEISFLQAIELF